MLRGLPSITVVPEVTERSDFSKMRGTDFTVPELIYFKCFGRAGLTKLIFKLGNVDFKDTQVEFDTWESEKNSK
jgi:hypothetical protein